MKKFLRYMAMILSIFMLGCADLPLAQDMSSNRVPMGVGLDVSDVACEEIRNVYLPARLQHLGILFKWADNNKEMLSVGPFLEEMSSEDVYPKLRQTYFLQISCGDELTTMVSGEVILEGLNTTGQWVWINDSVTIENQSMRFMQKLDL